MSVPPGTLLTLRTFGEMGGCNATLCCYVTHKGAVYGLTCGHLPEAYKGKLLQVLHNETNSFGTLTPANAVLRDHEKYKLQLDYALIKVARSKVNMTVPTPVGDQTLCYFDPTPPQDGDRVLIVPGRTNVAREKVGEYVQGTVRRPQRMILDNAPRCFCIQLDAGSPDLGPGDSGSPVYRYPAKAGHRTGGAELVGMYSIGATGDNFHGMAQLFTNLSILGGLQLAEEDEGEVETAFPSGGWVSTGL